MIRVQDQADDPIVIEVGEGFPQPPSTSYRLDPAEALPVSLKRILLEQIDRAYWQLTVPHDHRDVAVHDARKCLKKTRAVLRLIRDEMDPEVYRRENIFCRDAARELSALRSSAVMAETLHALVERYRAELAPEEIEPVRAGLMAMHEHAWRELVDDGDVLTQLAAGVAQDRLRIQNLLLEVEDFSMLRRGLKRSYRRGYRSMQAAYADPSTENFHQWRKRVKYLRYQMRVLRPLWEGPMQSLCGELDALSDLLGREHDLAELYGVLVANPHIFHQESQINHLDLLITWYRFALQVEARALGLRIYAESPKAFVKRLSGYWEALQAQKTDKG
ncbi:MAG: CHAD domain-containing protein [Chloroflexi bacterium]|nr:CHAD domain-containing protein [Chloroflexota bacterium]